MQQTIARATSRATPNAVSGGRRVVFRNEGIGRERLSSVMLPTNITFGVEVESFYPSNVDVSMLQATLNSCNAGRGWRLKNDSSIVCNPRVPSCYKAELASPVLRGTAGLTTVFDVVKAIKRHSPSVNKSTGLHVHVGIKGGWQLPQLKRLAHNFVQLESAYDQLVPKSRRGNDNHYCRSNLLAATAGSTRGKGAALALIESASSIGDLKQLVCAPADSRYMKMNLQALDRHGTVEFRHAGGSVNAAKVVAYVLLWAQLAEASLGNKPLASMAKKGYVFENLVKFYGFSPVLAHWLPRRRLELNPKGSGSSRAAGGSGAGGGSGGCGAGCGCSDCRH